ncbi:DUF6708 domain-containing protein [Paraburkholderia sp. Ac-20340]|uniref:DUF6708 domain-containing protein n=1 Tax=Paraburkholderia sp. Ac-20340 TaxID=2703888 RepID=UPI001F121903|nr:DUF6708 domain-containing protein [Paraburkholderia sp. Ac-20340]
MVAPKLNPPCRGWQQDLPGPNEPLAEAPMLLWLAPTHLDDIYLELARNTMAIRGLVVWFALFSVLMAPFFIWALLTIGDLDTNDGVEIALFALVDVAMLALCLWSAGIFYRMDVSPPRDLPLRFNRLRRKVYVYGFHSVWWNPFTRWYVTTASYDWDDLRAEKWKVRAATANGGLIIKEGVSIAVVRPGTNEVIERFDLSTRAANTSNVWAYVCHYMQLGRQGLDPSEAEPHDANDVPPYNLALRLAPRVEWPADMDAESRSAP